MWKKLHARDLQEGTGVLYMSFFIAKIHKTQAKATGPCGIRPIHVPAGAGQEDLRSSLLSL